MPKLRFQVPKYREHSSGRAVVTLDGRDIYLGPFGSETSRLEYDRLVAEWQGNGRRMPSAPVPTVDQLIERYMDWANSHFVKNGRPTSTIWGIRDALRYLHEKHGHTRSCDFGPLALRAVRDAMLSKELCRVTINKYITYIRGLFRWAVSFELLPPSILEAIKSVSGLQKGRTSAKESERVRPVPESDVEAVLPYLSLQVAAMVRLQLVTGMRPGEVVIMRGCDIDRDGADGRVWIYRPASHKTEHHGLERQIPLGPKAKSLLEPFLDRNPEEPLFSPTEAERARREAHRAPVSRKTATAADDKGTSRKRPPGKQYLECTYRRAIERACRKTGVGVWSPNRLRHNFATKVRTRVGLEAARTVLGHQSVVTTEIYAERDLQLATRVASELG